MHLYFWLSPLEISDDIRALNNVYYMCTTKRSINLVYIPYITDLQQRYYKNLINANENIDGYFSYINNGNIYVWLKHSYIINCVSYNMPKIMIYLKILEH